MFDKSKSWYLLSFESEELIFPIQIDDSSY